MLKAEDCILAIVDVQGKLAQVVDNSEALHQQLSTLIQGAQLFEIPTLWLEQLPDKLGHTTPSLAELLSLENQPIAKEHFSGWQAEGFRRSLIQSGRKQVILAGIETHICVYQTCRDLLEQGYHVHLVCDCVSSRTPENKQLGIEMMRDYGARMQNVESLLFELQHIAQGDRFRALLKLIK
ncbi:hydrolase [Shewanella submarina]|uniref:Hydrolase n=1 Tax=Shewanella submarina TaxID=2016376 RepID=A0ABV7G7I0_9GAMM|nr:hydrolase [Shewanella submarina]MCL1037132.1 hydrolase [Shewanella submarina]